jgi:hypothetical protein
VIGSLIERIFSDDFTFCSPLDVALDRKGYFDRCWPGAGHDQEFSFVRMIESGDELIATYEFTNASTGRRGRIAKYSFSQGIRSGQSKRTLDGMFVDILIPSRCE